MSVGTSETKYGMAFRRLAVQSLFSDQSLFNLFHFIRLLRPTSVMSYPMLDIANERVLKTHISLKAAPSSYRTCSSSLTPHMRMTGSSNSPLFDLRSELRKIKSNL